MEDEEDADCFHDKPVLARREEEEDSECQEPKDQV
jgi:hypothetical protein